MLHICVFALCRHSKQKQKQVEGSLLRCPKSQTFSISTFHATKYLQKNVPTVLLPNNSQPFSPYTSLLSPHRGAETMGRFEPEALQAYPSVCGMDICICCSARLSTTSVCPSMPQSDCVVLVMHTDLRKPLCDILRYLHGLLGVLHHSMS